MAPWSAYGIAAAGHHHACRAVLPSLRQLGSNRAVSATILAAAVLVQARAWRWLAFSIVLEASSCKQRSWSGMQRPIGSRCHFCRLARLMFTTVLLDSEISHAKPASLSQLRAQIRLSATVAALLYYLRDRPVQIVSWPSPDVRTFDTTRPLTKDAQPPLMFVTECPSAHRPAAYYTNVERIGEIRSSTGPASSRNHTVFHLSGPRGEFTALPSC